MSLPNPTEQLSADDEELFNFDARRYVKALKRYLLPLLALLACAVAVAVIYTSRQPRIYEAKASVQIEPKLPDLLGQGDRALIGLSGTCGAVPVRSTMRPSPCFVTVATRGSSRRDGSGSSR